MSEFETHMLLDSLREQLRDYEAALEWYANKMEWREHWFKMPRAYYIDKNTKPEEFLGWKIAKEALAKWKTK